MFDLTAHLTPDLAWRKAGGAGGVAPAFQADFTALSALPTGVSLARATTGTYFDVSGVLQTAAINAPRFDHAWNGSAWIATGLLIEEQRTNSALHSGTIGGTDWSLFAGVTVSTNAVVSPDGTTNGTTITFAANDVSQVYQGAGGSAATYSLSIWAKSSTGKKFRIVFTEGAVNRNSPDFTTTSSWQRFTFVWTATGGVSQISVCNVAAGDAGSFDAWGFQFELGSFATSYIPTTTAAVTRSADIPSASSPLDGYLAAGPSVWEFQDEATGTIARTAYAAGAFDWPVNKWYRSMGVYAAGTDTSGHMTNGSAY